MGLIAGPNVIGFETGDTSELTSVSGTTAMAATPIHGAYAFRTNPTTTGTGSGTITFTAAQTAVYARFNWRPDTLPASGFEPVARVGASAQSTTILVDSTGAISLQSGSAGTVAVVAGQVYRIEVKRVQNGANYDMEVLVDGVSSSTLSQASVASSTSVILGKLLNASGQTVDFTYDDVLILDSGYPGAGICIARQPKGDGSTPTDNAFTKSSGTDAGALWKDTPFNATTNCSSGTSGAAQTANIASFSSTQTGHGSETIGASDTINGCKALVVAKTSSTTSGGGACSVRYRPGPTDTAITLTTGDKLYASALFTDTLTNLNASEVGVIKGATTRTHTVEDVWLMVDYTPATVVPTFFSPEYPDFAPGLDQMIPSGTLPPAGTRR